MSYAYVGSFFHSHTNGNGGERMRKRGERGKEKKRVEKIPPWRVSVLKVRLTEWVGWAPQKDDNATTENRRPKGPSEWGGGPHTGSCGDPFCSPLYQPPLLDVLGAFTSLSILGGQVLPACGLACDCCILLICLCGGGC